MKKKILSIAMAVMMTIAAIPASMMVATETSFAADQDVAIAWVKAQVGKGIDMDGAYGCQCVDLIKAYYNYLGVGSYAKGNGAEYATNTLPPGWTRVRGGTPKIGDVLVYSGNSGNPYGHVAIFESTNSTYHQNYNGHPYVERVTISYTAFSNPYWGYIRPNWSSGSTPTPASTTDKWTSSASNITSTNAVLSATITPPSKKQFQWAGLHLMDANGNVVATAGESTSVNWTYMTITYNINTDTNSKYKLSPATTYKYKFYATYEGVDHFSPVYSFKTTGAHSHSWSAWSTTTAATCTKTGLKKRTCSCGAYETKSIEATGHSYGSWNTSKKATCTAVGERYRTCSKCKNKQTETIKALGHSYSHKIEAAQIGVDGREYDECSRCGKVTNVKNLSGSTPYATAITKISAVKKGFEVYWEEMDYSGYQIRYSKKSSMAGAKIITIKKSETTSKKITKLNSKKTYYVQVRTYMTINGKKVCSSWSTKVSVKTK